MDEIPHTYAENGVVLLRVHIEPNHARQAQMSMDDVYFTICSSVCCRNPITNERSTTHFQDGQVVRSLRHFYWLRWRVGLDGRESNLYRLMLPLPASPFHAMTTDGILRLSSLLWFLSASGGGKEIKCGDFYSLEEQRVVYDTLLQFLSLDTMSFEECVAPKGCASSRDAFYFNYDEEDEVLVLLPGESSNNSSNSDGSPKSEGRNSNIHSTGLQNTGGISGNATCQDNDTERERNTIHSNQSFHLAFVSRHSIASWWRRAKRQVSYESHSLPLRDLKPTKISPAMIKTGVVHRGWMSIEKANLCAFAVLSFEEKASEYRVAEASWTFAKRRVIDLYAARREESAALQNLRGAMSQSSSGALTQPALNLRGKPGTTKWTNAINLTKQNTPHDEMKSERKSDSTARAEEFDEADTLAAPPSARLQTYTLQLAALLCQSAHDALLPDVVTQSIALMQSVAAGSRTALCRAHEHMVFQHPLRAPPPPPGVGLRNLTLPGLQCALLEAMRVGGGGEGTLRILDSIDDAVGFIHDAADARMDAMTVELNEAARQANERLQRALRDWMDTELTALEATIGFWRAFNERLAADALLDEEPLTFLHHGEVVSEKEVDIKKSDLSGMQQDISHHVEQWCEGVSACVGKERDDIDAIEMETREEREPVQAE